MTLDSGLLFWATLYIHAIRFFVYFILPQNSVPLVDSYHDKRVVGRSVPVCGIVHVFL